MSRQRQPRILVVDDNDAVRRLIVRALEERGNEVVAVGDGRAGFESAQTAEVPFDLVVTNSYMPHVTGEQLIDHLRRLFPGLPILHLDDLSHRIGTQAEAVPTLRKPFSMDALWEAVALALAGRSDT